MRSFCLHELRFTADEAEKHVTAPSVAQRYPVIFSLIAQGQLHITGVLILAPKLTPENAEELLGAAADQTLREAARAPRPMVPAARPRDPGAALRRSARPGGERCTRSGAGVGNHPG
jgi:hypothetical protein